MWYMAWCMAKNQWKVMGVWDLFANFALLLRQ